MAVDNLLPPYYTGPDPDGRKLAKRLSERTRKVVERINADYTVVAADRRNVRELHRLRRNCRELRHLLKLVESRRGVPGLLLSLVKVQDLLGGIRDDDLLISFLAESRDHEMFAEVSARRERRYVEFVTGPLSQEGMGPYPISFDWLTG